MKVRVGGIAALGGELGGIDELAVGLGELGIGAERVVTGVGERFHIYWAWAMSRRLMSMV